MTLLNSEPTSCVAYMLDADPMHTNLKIFKYSSQELKIVQDVVNVLRGLQPSTKAMLYRVV